MVRIAKRFKMTADKRAEWLTFLFLAVLLAPAVAVAGIGGYGFLVWLLQ